VERFWVFIDRGGRGIGETFFSEREIKEALEEMNPNLAPGPDGLTMAFYKTFWESVKGPMMEMFKDFSRGAKYKQTQLWDDFSDSKTHGR
jgi:hypothetical protein